MIRFNNISSLKKDTYYIAMCDSQYAYVCRQISQKQWVAFPVNRDNPIYNAFQANGKAIVEQINASFGNAEWFYTYDQVKLRKAIMAVLVGKKPSDDVFASTIGDSVQVTINGGK